MITPHEAGADVPEQQVDSSRTFIERARIYAGLSLGGTALVLGGCSGETGGDEEVRYGQPEERSEEELDSSADTPEARDGPINFNQLELSPDVFKNPVEVGLDTEPDVYPIGTAFRLGESGWVVYIGQPHDITEEVYGKDPEPSQQGRAVMAFPVGMVNVGEPDAWGKPLNTSLPNIGVTNLSSGMGAGGDVSRDKISQPFLIEPTSFREDATVFDRPNATKYDDNGNIIDNNSIISGFKAFSIITDNLGEDTVIRISDPWSNNPRESDRLTHAEVFVSMGMSDTHATSAQEEPTGEVPSDSRPQSSQGSPEHTEELSGWKIGTTGEIIRGQEANDKVKEILGDFPIPNLDPGYEFGVVRVDVANPEGTAQDDDFFDGVNPQIIDENNDNQVGHENRMLIPHSAYPSPEDPDDQSRDVIFILDSKMLGDNPKLVLIVQAEGDHVKFPVE